MGALCCVRREVWTGHGWDYYKCKCCGCGCGRYTRSGGADNNILPSVGGCCCCGSRKLGAYGG